MCVIRGAEKRRVSLEYEDRDGSMGGERRRQKAGRVEAE